MAKTSPAESTKSETAPEAPAPEANASASDAALKARVAELEAALAAAREAAAANPFLVPADITKRPEAGPVHGVHGTPIFNVVRPTGRQG